MKKVIAITCLVAALGAGAFALNSVTSASAATPSDTASFTGNHRVRRYVVRDFGKVAADTIGITPQQLRDAVRNDGQSIAEVATAHNVDPAKVHDALITEGNRLIDQALANHKID